MVQSKIKTDQIDDAGFGNIATDAEVVQMVSGSFNQFDWQQSVIAIQNIPPSFSSKGDRYIVGPSPGGDWYNHNNEITYYDGSVWQFDIPLNGWVCWVKNIYGLLKYNVNYGGWNLLGDIQGDLYINYNSWNPSQTRLYFYNNGSPTDKYLEWDPHEGFGGSFTLTGGLFIMGYLVAMDYFKINYSIYLGEGTTGIDKIIYANNGDANLPVLQYNEATDKWQFSNDGLTFNDMRGSGSIDILCKGGTLYNSAGIANSALNIIVWRAPFACTVTNVRGYRVGGTGATINARKNGSSNHLASALSLTSANTWMDGGAVQNTAYAVGDKLEIMILSITGVVTQLAIQIDFTKP